MNDVSKKDIYSTSVRTKPNTFIGGVASAINSKELLAQKLGISVSRIKMFRIVNSDVQAQIINSYAMPNQVFRDNASITYFHDDDKLCSSLNTYSFYNCTNLISVKLEGVTRIAEGDFYNCRVKELNFPLLVSCGNQPFWGNPELLVINAPNLSNFTGTNNFATDCVKLHTINTPNIQRLSNKHCYNCPSLTTANFPLVTTVSNAQQFMGCTSLTSVNLPLLTLIGAQMFQNCINLTTISLPKAVTASYYSFYGCTSLTSVSLPELVTMSQDNFLSTKVVIVSLPKLTSCTTGNFSNVATLTTFNAPLIQELPSSNFRNCTALTTLTLPNLKILGAYVFSGCTALTNSAVFANLTSIGVYCFERCAFTEISLPLVTIMPQACLSGLPNLENVNIPLVTSVGQEVFFGCQKITSVNMPEVTSIGVNAFSGFGNYSLPIAHINVPKCTSLGVTTNTVENVFARVKSGIQITVKSNLQTANAGAPDADLVWVVANRAAVINYIS